MDRNCVSVSSNRYKSVNNNNRKYSLAPKTPFLFPIHKRIPCTIRRLTIIVAESSQIAGEEHRRRRARGASSHDRSQCRGEYEGDQSDGWELHCRYQTQCERMSSELGFVDAEPLAELTSPYVPPPSILHEREMYKEVQRQTVTCPRCTYRTAMPLAHSSESRRPLQFMRRRV